MYTTHFLIIISAYRSEYMYMYIPGCHQVFYETIVFCPLMCAHLYS